jgi:ankyrin repeat protein
MDMLSKKNIPVWEYKDKDNHDSSALNISVYKKSLKITKILIDYCKEKKPENLKDFIDMPNDQGIAPIHYASFRGDVPIIKLLIENGADITKTTKRGLNVIHYCAQGNKPNSLIYFYLKMRENIDDNNQYKLITDKDIGGSTSLHWAVYSLAEDLLLYLINLDIFDTIEDKEKFINELDNEGYSALHLSISSKSSRVAIRLLQNGANPLLKDKKGNTPLDLATKKKQYEMINILKASQGWQICNVKAPLKKVKKSQGNIICIFIFQFIANIIMFGSIIPIFLYKYHFGYILVFVYIFSLFLFFLVYFILLLMDPGVKRKRNVDDLKGLINRNADLSKYCYKCFVRKTRNTKHCIICDCCYEKFDHHCYWINKCVAKRNFCLFIFFLFETALYLILMLILSVLSIIKINILKEDKFKVDDFCNKFNYLNWEFFQDKCELWFTGKTKFIIHIIINILLILIILIFFIPELLLLILHIHVWCSNYREEKSRRTTSTLSTSLLSGDDSIIMESHSTSKV